MSNLALPLIVEPSELARHLGRDDLLIVDLSDRKGLTKLVRTQRCVPGAVHLDRSRIIAAQPPAMGLVPDERQLGELLSSSGLTSQTQVVAYDDLGNVHACRFLWTLDLVGQPRFSLLDGGLGAWLDEGKPSERRFAQPPPGDFEVALQDDPIADKDYVRARLDDPGVVILDTRSPAEFSGGHIPGAVNMDWSLAVDATRHSRLRSEAELRGSLAQLVFRL